MLLCYLFYPFNLLPFLPLLINKDDGLIIINLLLSLYLCYIFKNLKDFYNLNLHRRKELRPTIFFTN